MATVPAQNIRDAIELMTAWTASPEGPGEVFQGVLSRHLDNRPPEVAAATSVELIMKMTTLCGVVLALRELEVGVSIEDTLRELALRHR
jgi:hypothetical protein